jgi:hypothetical protein
MRSIPPAPSNGVNRAITARRDYQFRPISSSSPGHGLAGVFERGVQHLRFETIFTQPIQNSAFGFFRRHPLFCHRRDTGGGIKD